MTAHRYLQLDVFADRPGTGNPLGVVFDADGLDGATMQSIANWTNLSETIFLLPPTSAQADYRVRIFTPRRELPFAGHPSVGAAWAALDHAMADARDGQLVQECAAGLLPVRIERRDDRVVPHVRAPRARCLVDDGGHAVLLDRAVAGLARAATPCALWDNGPQWWLVELVDGDAVRRAAPELPAIAALCTASGAVGLCVHGRSGDADHDVVVRAFCPADDVPEDPVTGSANALVAADLHARGALPRGAMRYVASQGREMGRDGRVDVQVDDAGEIWIGGAVQAVVRGDFTW